MIFLAACAPRSSNSLIHVKQEKVARIVLRHCVLFPLAFGGDGLCLLFGGVSLFITAAKFTDLMSNWQILQRPLLLGVPPLVGTA